MEQEILAATKAYLNYDEDLNEVPDVIPGYATKRMRTLKKQKERLNKKENR